jgi:hypothetical protein
MMQIFGIFTAQLILFTFSGRQYEKNQVKQDGKKINNTSQKSPHPEVTSLPVSELNNVEKIEVGPSGNNVSSALNPNIDLIAKINELERKKRQLTEQNLKLQTKSFSVNNFLSSDKDISYYTGFPNVKIFMSVFELVENPTQYCEYLKKCLNENLGRKRLIQCSHILQYTEETFFSVFQGKQN